MFERFTDRARRVLVLAQEEARLLNHSYIGTEHILLGLIHDDEGLAAKALESLDISLEAVREKVVETIGPAGSAPTGSPPFTPRAKKVLELSLREALQLGHNYIGTEHILLGLVREGEGVAAQVLQSLGADLPRVRQEVIQQLSGEAGRDLGGPHRTGPWIGPMEPAGRFAEIAWPRYPNRVVAGPADRLHSDGMEFGVTGALLFDVGCQLYWRLAGIPSPIVELLLDPSSDWPTTPVDGPPLGAIRGGSGARRPAQFTGPSGPPFLELSDSSGTTYRILRTTFEPQATSEWAGSTFFGPGVPKDATGLVVSWRGESLRLDLAN